MKIPAVAAPLSLAVAFSAVSASAETVAYQQPPQPIARILDAPRNPVVTYSPDDRWLAELQRPGLPPIAEIAEPYLPFAGARVNPATHGPAREQGYTGLSLKSVESGTRRDVPLPEGRLRGMTWSHDSRRLAFTMLKEDGIELWLLDIPDGAPRRLTPPILNATFGSPCSWLPGDEGLVCSLVANEGVAPPRRESVPAGALVEESRGRRTANRTYQDLLASASDEALFEHHGTSVVEHVALDGTRKRILGPALHASVAPSPDGRWLLVSKVLRPFSWQVPWSRFPSKTEVVDREGRLVRTIAELPLADDVPITFDSVRRGPRGIGWRDDRDATLAWIEALDGGDAKAKAQHRDALLQLDAPFAGEPATLFRSEMRLRGPRWGSETLALVSEGWYATRRTRTWRIDPSKPDAPAKLLFDRDSQDAYSDPGWPVTKSNGRGGGVLLTAGSGRSIYLVGRGASERGVHPFLDRMDLATLSKERLFESKPGTMESVVAVLDDDARRIITVRETRDEPPNHHLVTRRTGRRIALTAHPDPAPEFAGLEGEVIKYRRADGLELSGTLYLPPGHDVARDGRLPVLLWAYPSEYKDRAAASRVTASDAEFTRPAGSSHLFLLTQGWAILDGPTLPILGEGEAQPNDTYVQQLVAGARAAVDALVERGVADPDRIAIGGHSYGAFTTANLLAHSDLFRAGIARSGAYNRTLTPWGFQGEERSYWEAPDTYRDMSPFHVADRIDEPLLMIHGQEDSNSGTFPIQSERLYEAVKGLGGSVRLVMLPKEDHGYRARESVGHALWEMARWLDEHVAKAPPRIRREAAEVAASPAEAEAGR